MKDAPHPFTSTSFLIGSALLIWIGHFLISYVIAALACARGLADVRVAGVGLVSALVLASTVLAGAATAVLMRKAWQASRRPAADEHSRFIAFLVLATGCLALVGLVYVVLPPLFLAAQCLGGA